MKNNVADGFAYHRNMSNSDFGASLFFRDHPEARGCTDKGMLETPHSFWKSDFEIGGRGQCSMEVKANEVEVEVETEVEVTSLSVTCGEDSSFGILAFWSKRVHKE